MKLLKLIKPFGVVLSSGRTDFTTFSLDPTNSTVPYADIVIEDINSNQYNQHVIEEYINNGILTVLQLADPKPAIVWGDVVFSRVDPHAGSPVNSWAAEWPVSTSVPITSVAFKQGAYTGGSNGVDCWTLSANTISNGNLQVTISSSQGYSAAYGAYTCTLTINGVAVTATASIEHTYQGS